ncbi:Uncharacterised protein [Mycobacteroides abscessus subsp. abscessus]|nr:Uncharacterised protein [Mycobacteroides abscessus subsp. abscessus]
MLTQGALQVTQIGVRANLSSVVLFMVDSILITFFGGCMRIAVLVQSSPLDLTIPEHLGRCPATVCVRSGRGKW